MWVDSCTTKIKKHWYYAPVPLPHTPHRETWYPTSDLKEDNKSDKAEDVEYEPLRTFLWVLINT